MAEKKLKTFTLEEYLAFENQSDVKNEFDHGSIVAMSGGTLNHGIIGNNITTATPPNSAISSSTPPS